MNNQKTFLAAFGVVLTVALIILGVSFSSLNSQTNNSKKVVADIKFENAYDFKVRLKSTDGSL
jgi:CHASE3 domain sensor protein